MNTGYGAAVLYGYSNAYVKAIESKLISKATMQGIGNAGDMHSILSILINTEYKKNLEDFGGMDITTEMIDFALSKNLGESINRLSDITPLLKKKTMVSYIAKWDLYNIKLSLEAKDRAQRADTISKYLINTNFYNSAFIRQAMDESANVEDLLAKYAMNSPYKQILQSGIEAYKKNRNILEVNIELDKAYYESIGRMLFELGNEDRSVYMIIRNEIEMRNIMSLLRAKRGGISFARIKPFLISRGFSDESTLAGIFESSKDTRELAQQISRFDLKPVLEAYEKTGNLLYFEIKMRKEIFEMSNKSLRHSVLCFGTIFEYMYQKEIEVSMLRLIVKAVQYNLNKAELSAMLV
ncbi:MAG: V-type ATPase subunit [Candidatus Marsarchaeota archaeon]|nr:V-type ATPase subunit [Candidatus Marsarchaeota archaeon]